MAPFRSIFEAKQQKRQSTTENCILCFFRFLRRWPPPKSDPPQPANKQTKTITQNSLVCCVFISVMGWRFVMSDYKDAPMTTFQTQKTKKTNNGCTAPFMFFSFPSWNWGFYVMSSFKDAPKTIFRSQETNKANTDSKLPCMCVWGLLFYSFPSWTEGPASCLASHRFPRFTFSRPQVLNQRTINKQHF